MTYHGNITVLNKTGWSKLFNLEKSLVMVGSDSLNDIVLSDEIGSGVAPMHFQLICEQNPEPILRILNLRNTPITRVNLLSFRNAPIQPQKMTQLFEGDQLTLGSYTLTISLVSYGFIKVERSENLGMELKLPHLNLRQNEVISGKVKLTNFSQQKYSQFNVDLIGLPIDCYQIDPVPMLYPGASEELAIHIFHRNNQPPAGECAIQLLLTASQSFPTELVTIDAVLHVEPVFSFSSGFLVDEELVDEVEEVSIPAVVQAETEPENEMTHETTPALAVEAAEVEPVAEVVKSALPEEVLLVEVQPESIPTEPSTVAPSPEVPPAMVAQEIVQEHVHEHVELPEPISVVEPAAVELPPAVVEAPEPPSAATTIPLPEAATEAEAIIEPEPLEQELAADQQELANNVLPSEPQAVAPQAEMLAAEAEIIEPVDVDEPAQPVEPASMQSDEAPMVEPEAVLEPIKAEPVEAAPAEEPVEPVETEAVTEPAAITPDAFTASWDDFPVERVSRRSRTAPDLKNIRILRAQDAAQGEFEPGIPEQPEPPTGGETHG